MATSTTTQGAHPWRATLRTVVAGVVGFAAVYPTLIDLLHLPGWSVVAGSLAVAGAVTRVAASPVVEGFLRVYLPFLSAAPSGSDTPVVEDPNPATPSGTQVLASAPAPAPAVTEAAPATPSTPPAAEL